MVQARVRQEEPHDGFRRSQQWKKFAEFVGDSTYTSLVFPDGELDLQHCDIDMDSAEFLRDALMTNTTLKSLNLNDNQLGKFGTAAIAEMLRCVPPGSSSMFLKEV